MKSRQQQNGNKKNQGPELSGGTGSMRQNSASMLAEENQAAPPVRKQIGKAKQNRQKPE